VVNPTNNDPTNVLAQNEPIGISGICGKDIRNVSPEALQATLTLFLVIFLHLEAVGSKTNILNLTESLTA
jgi:hypothetical protein